MHRSCPRFGAAGAAALVLLPLSLVLPAGDVAVAATPSTVSCTAPSGPAPSSAVVGGFHGVSPERLVDTRQAQPVPPGCWLRVPVPASVPANAQVLALTVTSDRALSPGFLTVHGCGSSLPELSNLNVRPEGPTANLAVVAIDATRHTCIFSDRGTDLLVDLVGWFGPGGSPFQEFAPRRAIDTRSPLLRPPGVTGAPSVGQFVEIPRDMLGVPADAEAVVVNLTVTQATGYGYLTAFPCGDDPPNTSNVNYNSGVDRANTSIMALGPHGSLCVRLSESSAHVVVDVNGWFGGATGIRYGARPQRIADSRNGQGGWSGTFAPAETRTLNPEAQVPAGSRVAVLGVTSTVSSTAGFITVQPCGGQAEVSNVNFVGGVDITNLVVVPLADDGTICVTSSARTHIVVDVFGGFGTGGLARELSISGATMFPEFAPAQHDYIAYCQNATANQLSVHALGMPRTQVTVDSTIGTTVVDTVVSIDADRAIVVSITPIGGGATDEYWIRCLPPDFPRITTTGDGEHPPGWYVLGNGFDGPSGEFAMILDSAGAPVWYRRIPSPMMALDVEPWSDGSMTWFTSPGTPLGLNGAHHYERRSLSGTVLATYATSPAPTDHHELLEVPDGSGDVIMIGFEIRTSADSYECTDQTGASVMTSQVAVPIIQRVGSQPWQWDAAFTEPAAKITNDEVTVPFCFTPPGSDPIYMPIHVNSLDLAPDGTVIFTARHTDAVYAFDPASGDILWKLGGTDTPERLDNIVGDQFGGPLRMHDVRVLPNGNISLFDNRTFLPFASPQGSGPARYVEYDIDIAANTATMVREVRRANGNFSGAMGSARLQPDGGVVLNWGAVPGPIFTETDPSGTTVFELFMPDSDNASYRTIKVPPNRFDINDLRANAGK